jgi:hypothetical protein
VEPLTRAVEAAGSMRDVTGVVQRYKQRFVERLADIAAEAGAQEPQHLAGSSLCSSRAQRPCRPLSTATGPATLLSKPPGS